MNKKRTRGKIVSTATFRMLADGATLDAHATDTDVHLLFTTSCDPDNEEHVILSRNTAKILGLVLLGLAEPEDC